MRSRENYGQGDSFRQQVPLHGKSPSNGRSYRFSVKGIISKGERTDYSIAGEDFSITPETWVIGKIRLGVAAHVIGMTHPGKGRFAAKVTVHS